MIQFSALTTVISVMIALCSLAFGIWQYNKKSNKEDLASARTRISQDVSRITEVIIKLDHIKDDTNEIKGEIRDIRKEMSELNTRITKAEMKITAAHQRMDDHFGKDLGS